MRVIIKKQTASDAYVDEVNVNEEDEDVVQEISNLWAGKKSSTVAYRQE